MDARSWPYSFPSLQKRAGQESKSSRTMNFPGARRTAPSWVAGCHCRNELRESAVGSFAFKGEVRRKMNFTYVLGFVVLRSVVKVFPVSSSSFARKTTGRNRARSHSGA